MAGRFVDRTARPLLGLETYGRPPELKEPRSMFVALFGASFVLALALSVAVAWVSREAIESVLRRFVADHVVRAAFSKYIRFAIVVVGISTGTRVRVLQEYISATAENKAAMAAALTQVCWVLALYRTIVRTLPGMACMPHLYSFRALGAHANVPRSERESTPLRRAWLCPSP